MRRFPGSRRSKAVAKAAVIALALLSAPVGANAQEGSGVSKFAAGSPSPVFDSSDELVTAFKQALVNNEVSSLASLLGLDPERVLDDEATVETFLKIRDGVARKLVIDRQGKTEVLKIGEHLWPFPFPIIRDDDGKWSFDTTAGLEEIVNRRVGENELQAIATAREYVDAQREYATQDHDGDGVLEYAQKLISSEGQTDGLYWPASLDAGQSPAGDFVDEKALDTAQQGQGYFGYRFRILTGQGDNVAGGAYDYVINGNMIAGFALIAWPMAYAETGVKTFVVNQQGTVYETDLGAATGEIVKFIDRFNPDEKWDLVSN